MKKSYKTLLLDLDRTLWDYESNSAETLHDLFITYDLAGTGLPSQEAFLHGFRRYNDQYWGAYTRGETDLESLRVKRFEDALQLHGVKNLPLAEKLSVSYLEECPRKNKLMPECRETLDYLSRKYRLFITSNGEEEIQSSKLRYAGLLGFFEGLFGPGTSGFLKPHREYFAYALKASGSSPRETMVVGDCPNADMFGAQQAGLDRIFYNPSGKTCSVEVTAEINCLSDLRTIL